MESLIEKLVHIQSELKAPKSQRNTFSNYNFRKAEDILEAVKPLLKATGTVLMMSDSIDLIGDRYYVKATATITDGKESYEVMASAREEETKKGMDGSQITGASSSYARKYALNGLFTIDDTADSDHTNDGKLVEAKQETKATNATKPKQTLLNPKVKEWNIVIDALKSKGKTSDDWPAIKPNYIITDADEKALFKALNWNLTK